MNLLVVARNFFRSFMYPLVICYAIETGHRNSEFSPLSMVIFQRYVNVYQRVNPLSPSKPSFSDCVPMVFLLVCQGALVHSHGFSDEVLMAYCIRTSPMEVVPRSPV